MKRTPAQVLAESRRQDSRDKRMRVLAVVDEMAARGELVTFAAVAKAAGVSNWLVYAEGVREHIEKVRAGQAGAERRKAREGSTASAASLATDLELARAELKATRAERDKLKAAVQRSLGKQVDQAASSELAARIQELVRQLDERDEALRAVTAERDELRQELAEAQDDLISARAALKTMMRTQNAGGEP